MAPGGHRRRLGIRARSSRTEPPRDERGAGNSRANKASHSGNLDLALVFGDEVSGLVLLFDDHLDDVVDQTNVADLVSVAPDRLHPLRSVLRQIVQDALFDVRGNGDGLEPDAG